MHLGVELLGHRLTLYLIFSGMLDSFPKLLYHFTCPPAMSGCSNFSTSLPILVIVCFFVCLFVFNYNLPSGCEVVSHCGFDLHFPNEWWCWKSFHVLIGHLYIFLGEISLKTFDHLKIVIFVFLFLSCNSSLYTLDTGILSYIWVANIFSHFMGCLFTFFMVSFEA